MRGLYNIAIRDERPHVLFESTRPCHHRVAEVVATLAQMKDGTTGATTLGVCGLVLDYTGLNQYAIPAESGCALVLLNTHGEEGVKCVAQIGPFVVAAIVEKDGTSRRIGMIDLGFFYDVLKGKNPMDIVNPEHWTIANGVAPADIAYLGRPYGSNEAIERDVRYVNGTSGKVTITFDGGALVSTWTTPVTTPMIILTSDWTIGSAAAARRVSYRVMGQSAEAFFVPNALTVPAMA